jgi:2-oxo-3-hexenedioate decarboxylase
MVPTNPPALNADEITRLAQVLDDARLSAREIGTLSSGTKFSIREAYLIQDEGIRFREKRGERPIGFKMGFTSEAKRKQMGLGAPIYGILTDRMRLQDGGEVHLQGSIHPKIEPEIAFMIGRELRGKITRDQALDACTGVAAAMEILDSRYAGFKYFSLEDVVADNASSSLFILSRELHDPRQVDVADLQMTMESNGKIEQQARSSAISGHPAQSIVQLCELLSERGLSLPAESIVLAGAATAAIPLIPGLEVRTHVEKLGTVSIGAVP